MIKKIIILLFTFLVLTGCLSVEKSAYVKSEEGSLSIYNDTTQDVIVFVGRVEKNITLGRVESGKEFSFSLNKLPNIPKRGDLLIRIVPAKVCEAKTKITESDVVYTRLVVYDLMAEKSKTELEIPRVIDTEQKYGFYVTNPSYNFILEVRKESPTGEVIATLLPGERNKRVFLLPRDDRMSYKLFPSFIYVGPRSMEVTTINSQRENIRRVVPKQVTEAPQMIQFIAPSNYAVPYDVAFIKLSKHRL